MPESKRPTKGEAIVMVLPLVAIAYVLTGLLTGRFTTVAYLVTALAGLFVAGLVLRGGFVIWLNRLLSKKTLLWLWVGFILVGGLLLGFLR